MIGGIVPCSFLDFPGCLSAVIFLRGCNLRCPYCHNPELIESKVSEEISFDTLENFLYQRRGKLRGIVVSGGEPTLSPHLSELLTLIRRYGYKIKLDTNGQCPKQLATVLASGCVDYVALDLKDLPEKYPVWLGCKASPAALRTSMSLLRESGIAHEYRTTWVMPHHDVSRLLALAELIADDPSPWFLQPVRLSESQESGGVRRPSPQELSLGLSVLARTCRHPVHLRSD